MAAGPLIAIVGQTASGKSALALEIAERYDGEIICADSRTVYEGMDIGTAKPSAKERAKIPHHLLDVVRPDQKFSAADFKRLATQAIHAIHVRGKLPIMVGGTGLYVDAVLYEFEFRPKGSDAEQERLNTMSVDKLQNELMMRGIELPANKQNPRHLIRALQTGGVQSMKKPLRANTLVLGVRVEQEMLHLRIAERVMAMMEAGLDEEVLGLADEYDWDTEAMKAVGYREFRAYVEGDASFDEIRSRIIKSTQDYAKRQRTWFKRNRDIQWIGSVDETIAWVDDFLNNNR